MSVPSSCQLTKAPRSGTSGRKLALAALTLGIVSIIKVGLQLMLLPVMARLLGPAEFGLYALALPTVSLVSLFVDGGLGQTLSREAEDTALVWSSAFWILLLAGCVFALGTSGFGVVLGYYIVAQPGLPAMIALLSLSLIFQVIAVPPLARLTRRRNLSLPALADLFANLAGAAVAVSLALWGAGAWSLAFQFLSVSLLRSLALNAAAFEMPKFQLSFASIRPHLLSGGLLVGSRLWEYAGRVSENIGIERFFGTHFLGTYTFANQISRFVAEALGNVTWSTLYVQALTGERAQVVDLHRKLCRLLAAILFPGSALVMAAAPELIDLLLGPNWSELAFPLRMFLPASSLVVIATQVGALLLAGDRLIVQFWCLTTMTVARVAVVFAGPWIGIDGVIFGLAGISLIYSIALLLFSKGSMGFALSPLLGGLIGPAISSAIGAAACRSVLAWGAEGAIMTLLSLVAGAIAFLGAMLVIDRKSLIDDWDAVLRLLRSTQRPAQFTPDI